MNLTIEEAGPEVKADRLVESLQEARQNLEELKQEAPVSTRRVLQCIELAWPIYWAEEARSELRERS